MKQIDCNGLGCPEPVIRTKKALDENPDTSYEVIVDNETARENVLRFVKNRGHKAKWSEDNGLYKISIEALDSVSLSSNNNEAIGTEMPGGPVLLISTNQLGQGSEELGTMLMRNFIYTLTKRDDLPETIIFMNSGVKLSTVDSPVVEELNQLEENGTRILVCGTCLDYFKLKEVHRCGEVSNMYDITDLIFAATRVVTV
jgi:selenium metabolism protein YedF